MARDQPGAPEARAALDHSKDARERAARQQRGDWRVLVAMSVGAGIWNGVPEDGPRLISGAVLIVALLLWAAILQRRSPYRARWLDANMGLAAVPLAFVFAELLQLAGWPLLMAATAGGAISVLITVAGTAAAKIGLR